MFFLLARTSPPSRWKRSPSNSKASSSLSGGKVEKTEYWGVKSVAYRIKKNRKAHFTLLNIDAPSAALNELERQEGLNEDILRFLTVRVEELEAGPSAMLRKRDDDDRGDRGDRGGRGARRRPWPAPSAR